MDQRALAAGFRWQNWPTPRASRALAAAGHILAWLARPGRPVPRIGGLARSYASIEGNALAACCRLGLAADPRVRSLAGSLIAWQWPDGGWNCDPAATGRRSSFHESLAPAWVLHEYWQATGDPAARDAASRTAGLFLARRLFRTLTTGQVIHRARLAPHYPPCWHYDILQALLVLSRMGPGPVTSSMSWSGGACPTVAGKPDTGLRHFFARAPRRPLPASAVGAAREQRRCP